MAGLSSMVFGLTRMVLHVYERAGDLTYGEVEVGRETVIFE